MEVVVFLAMMIVPFISIASLIVSVMAMKRSAALRDVVLTSLSGQEKRDAEKVIKLREI